MNNTVDNDFFWISHGKVSTSDRLDKQTCKNYVKFSQNVTAKNN